MDESALKMHQALGPRGDGVKNGGLRNAFGSALFHTPPWTAHHSRQSILCAGLDQHIMPRMVTSVLPVRFTAVR